MKEKPQIFNCRAELHDYHKIKEHQVSRYSILNDLGVDTCEEVLAHFAMHPVYFGISICVDCGKIKDDKAEFTEEVSKFIKESGVIRTHKELRDKICREHYDKAMRGPRGHVVGAGKGI
jgi:hypothetical protein